jgi:hypothetical protein
LWDPGITCLGFFLERVLGTVLCDDRDVSLHLHVSRVVDYDSSGFEFYFLLLGFYLRDFAAHSDGASPADADVVYSFVYSGLYGHVFIFIIILFIL